MNETSAPQGSMPVHKRRGGRITGLVAFSGVVVALAWNVLQPPDRLCALSAERLGNALPTCGETYRTVTDDDAVATLRAYYGRSSGADPMNGWVMLGAAERGRVPADEFHERWDPMLWAEVLGALDRSTERRGTFRATVRMYHESGEVTTRTVDVALQYEDSEVVIAREGRWTRVGEPEQLVYPRLELGVRSPTLLEPSLDAAVAGPAGHYSVGGRFITLCKLDREGDPDGGWVRTDQGWIEASKMIGVAEVAEVLPDCDPRS